MTTHRDPRPVLIIGATGKTGRRVADLLAPADVPVRRASRTSATPFDWTDRSTWAPALDGTAAAYITYQPDLIVPGALDDITELVTHADRAGVERLVLLAGRGEPEAVEAGRILHTAQADSTVLDCAWFNQNFSEGGFADEIAAGVLTLPVGEVGEPFLDVHDIAAVAAAALCETAADGRNPHAGRTYELTGPRLLTFADVVRELAAARGTAVTLTSVGSQEYREYLGAFGTPNEEVDMVSNLFGTLFDGRNAHVTDDVERVLGRPPIDFADFAASVFGVGATR
ncbi:NmrA family transcriptional regulator [Gordonia sp. CPCC 205515]|uniref:NmrA family transcriptional regulator n=1 Tax=Gordonia sp. CPCC 205515 TaxID=3140791 RepID=UPI003AF3743E